MTRHSLAPLGWGALCGVLLGTLWALPWGDWPAWLVIPLILVVVLGALAGLMRWMFGEED